MSDNVAVGAGKLGNRNLRPLYYGGHCFLVRKCFTGEQVGEDFFDRQLGGIILPQQTADRSLVVEVLAKGSMVGKRCSKEHKKFHNRPRCLSDDVKVGDMLLCPNMDATRIQRSPLAEFEIFIEESLPLAIIETGEKLWPKPI